MNRLQMHRQTSTRNRNGEQGYVLLTLLLVVSLMIIFAAAIVPSITFEIRRDKEEELIHRGVQYSRAIRAYYKKFGSYPARIEQLENTNNLRFLRKRYKDPITGGDFRLLHYGEVQMSTGGGIQGATAVSAMNGAPGSSGSAFGQSSTLGGGNTFGQSSFGQSSTFGGNSAFGNSNSTFGQNQPTNNQATGSEPPQAAPGNSDAGNPEQNVAQVPGTGGNNDVSSASQQVQAIGGMPIVGVASLSKKETIREFNHKRKYNEWQFIYDPGTDRGGLLMTPNQPPLMPQAAPVNGQTGTNGSGNSFGNGIGTQPFGGQGGFQNYPQNGPAQPAGGAPQPPPDQNNPPQQQ